MRKTKKRALGILGLSLVAVMTFAATMIPGPEASATASITDTIQVRVIGSTPMVKFDQPKQNTETTNSTQNFNILYENVTQVRIAASYTNKDGVTVSAGEKIYSDLSYAPGSQSFPWDLSTLGYGKYVFSLYGTGSEGSEVPFDSIVVEYLPIIGSAAQAEDKDSVDVTIDSVSDEVETVDIYIDGKLIKTIPKDELGDGNFEIPLDGLDTGNHTLSIIAKDTDGNDIYLPYEMTFYYEAIAVPDTGGFFQNLNISKEDYLVTGLIIFFTLGIVGFVIVAKGNSRKVR